MGWHVGYVNLLIEGASGKKKREEWGERERERGVGRERERERKNLAIGRIIYVILKLLKCMSYLVLESGAVF